jgi:hypothetical protein
MTKLPSRLRRQLSYANVMATIAVFLTFGGVGYAAATINGNKIVQQTIGAGKLKKGTLTNAQVKANALTGSVIDESTLSVPSAQTAATATTAGSASTAASANTANSATTAKSATSAETAGSASTAKSAATADHALTADSATTATTATSAGSAATAGDADTLDGLTAEQLRIACPASTELFGGMCWDDDPRPIAGWITASITCGNAGGRLPSLSELIAYIAQPGPPVSEHWSGDASDHDPVGNEEIALTRDESGTASKRAPVSLGYRCLFYRAN